MFRHFHEKANIDSEQVFAKSKFCEKICSKWAILTTW